MRRHGTFRCVPIIIMSLISLVSNQEGKLSDPQETKTAFRIAGLSAVLPDRGLMHQVMDIVRKCEI